MDLVIRALAEVQLRNWTLDIIGDGPEKETLENLVKLHGLEEQINFIGRIHDKAIQREYFKKADFSISYLQAGLSVLTSLAYGVPVIVNYKAISGGEIENVRNFITGFKVSNEREFLSLLHFLIRNRSISSNMSFSAKEHYWTKCNPESFVSQLASIL